MFEQYPDLATSIERVLYDSACDNVELKARFSDELGGESVLLDLASEQYFGLDETGTRIWQLIGELGELQGVFDQMQKEYEVDADQLEKDLKDLVDQLSEAELVTFIKMPGSSN